MFIISTFTLLGDSNLKKLLFFVRAPGGYFYFVIIFYFITIVINNEVVLAPKLCTAECSRYVTRGRGVNLSKKSYLHLHLQDLVLKIGELYLNWQKGLFIFVLFSSAFDTGCSISEEQVSLYPTPLWLAIFQIITIIYWLY